MIMLSLSVLVGAAIIATTINRRSKDMTAALDRLKKEVAETRGVAASAVAALTAIPQLIRDAVAAAVEKANGDASVVEAEMTTLADDLDAAQADIAGAISQNPGPADSGGGGGETLSGGAGEDTTTGAESGGNDTVDGGGANDVVDEG